MKALPIQRERMLLHVKSNVMHRLPESTDNGWTDFLALCKPRMSPCNAHTGKPNCEQRMFIHSLRQQNRIHEYGKLRISWFLVVLFHLPLLFLFLSFLKCCMIVASRCIEIATISLSNQWLSPRSVDLIELRDCYRVTKGQTPCTSPSEELLRTH